MTMAIHNIIEEFRMTLKKIGMDEIVHPIFYHALVGIRFEVGDEKYFGTDEYVQMGFKRAVRIYDELPTKPSILRIDLSCHIDERNVRMEELYRLCHLSEQTAHVQRVFADGQIQLQLYWDLNQTVYDEKMIINQILLADLGGNEQFSSSVYFVDVENAVLYHLYDDRGLDLVAGDKEVLRLIYTKYNEWILKYDKKDIQKIFE